MQLGEFFIALGFDVDDDKLKEFKDDIAGLGKDFLKISTVAAGTVYAINAFVSGGVAAATAMRNFNTETGNSIEALQRWQVGATLTNAATSADQVTASFHAMANSIADVTMGKGPVGAYSMLGIDNVRGMDVGEVMEQLRANFDNNVNQWGLPQTVNLMRDIGFDPGMLNSLKLTRKEFDKLVGGKMLDPESRERLVRLGDAISKFKWDFKLWKDELFADMSPKLIEFIEIAIPYMKDFYESLKAVGGALRGLWDDLDDDWQGAMKIIAGGLVAYFAPVTATFVALAAAIWDIGRALRGLESYTGKSILWLLNLMESEEGSKIANWKKALEDAGNGDAKGVYPVGKRPSFQNKKDLGYTPVPQDFLKKSDLMRFYDGTLNPSNSKERQAQQMIQENQTNMNNVWNIQSNADGMSLTELIMQRQKQMLDSTLAEQNNGVRY